MVPHLQQVEFNLATATGAMMLLAFFGMSSKLIFGRLSETITARLAFVVIMILQGAGLAVLIVSGGSVAVWGPPIGCVRTWYGRCGRTDPAGNYRHVRFEAVRQHHGIDPNCTDHSSFRWSDHGRANFRCNRQLQPDVRCHDRIAGFFNCSFHDDQAAIQIKKQQLKVFVITGASVDHGRMRRLSHEHVTHEGVCVIRHPVDAQPCRLNDLAMRRSQRSPED